MTPTASAISDRSARRGAQHPGESNRKWKPCFSKVLYRERNLVERFFSKLKHFRRIANRYDNLAENFLAMVQLASMRLSLRACPPNARTGAPDQPAPPPSRGTFDTHQSAEKGQEKCGDRAPVHRCRRRRAIIAIDLFAIGAVVARLFAQKTTWSAPSSLALSRLTT